MSEKEHEEFATALNAYAVALVKGTKRSREQWDGLRDAVLGAFAAVTAERDEMDARIKSALDIIEPWRPAERRDVFSVLYAALTKGEANG